MDRNVVGRTVGKNAPTLLLAGHEPMFIYLVSRYTSEMGYRLVLASPGDQAVEVARLERPAVIVLDLSAIETGGGKLLETLRTDRATRDIPVVLCSWLERGPQDGPDGVAAYLRKPISFQEFSDALVTAERPGRR